MTACHSGTATPNPERLALSLRVLLVDMNEDVSAVFTMLFEDSGHTVTTVRSGAEAIAIVRVSPPDAVFTSIRIGAIDGYELCAVLRQLPETKDCLIFALTGGGVEETKDATETAGFNGYFIKPVNLEEMLSALKPLEHRRALH